MILWMRVLKQIGQFLEADEFKMGCLLHLDNNKGRIQDSP